jgi:hypothetical protein
MIKHLERRNKLEKMSSLQKQVLVNLQLKFQEEEELNSVTEDMVINISQHIEDKVKDEVKEWSKKRKRQSQGRGNTNYQ